MTKPVEIIDIYGGIAVSKKIGQQGSFRFGKHLNITDDPNDLTLQLTGTKKSGSIVTGLIKWIVDATPFDTNRYAYDENGVIYQINSSDVFSIIRSVSSSKGQGLEVHDDYLYYTQNTQIGRYGPLSTTPTFTDNWQTGLNDTSTSKFAPIITLNDRLIVGHGNNISTWDGAVWTLAALTLPAELNVRSFTRTDQYIVIGAWRGIAVTDSEDGYMYLWDALSDTFNDSYPTEGGLNAMNYYRNKLLSIQGKNGVIYTETSPFNKVHQIPNLEIKKYVEVYPGAITSWNNLTFFGVSNSDSSNVVRGVYSYGSKTALFAETLNYAITISTGESDTSVQIGSVKGIGNDLYIAWKSDSTYGVDKVDETSSYATSGTYESLIVDDSRPGDPKKPVAVIVSHLPLVSGESITISKKYDRATTFTAGDTNSTADSKETRLDFTDRFLEFEWRTTLAGTGSTTPTVTSQKFLYDDLKDERED